MIGRMYALWLARVGMKRQVCLLTVVASLGAVAPVLGQSSLGLSLYGVPGYVEMPSGFALPDGTVAFSANTNNVGIGQASIAFQVTKRMTGVFRYSNLKEFVSYDRSFDFRYMFINVSI